MFSRKIYLQLRMFFYSNRDSLNTFAMAFIMVTLFYLFINYIVVERIIVSQANNDETSQKYSNAIVLYNVAYFYYKNFHYNETNKDIYFEIPYRRAMCYLKNDQKSESVNSMLEGLRDIQKQYGIFSSENAYFIRKYLVDYYLENNRDKLAEREFENLQLINKNLRFNQEDMADIIRLKADLFYQQKQYDYAIQLYQQAYKLISTGTNIDFDILVKIVDRIANYQIENENYNSAIELYKNAIELIAASNRSKRNQELAAGMLINLGNLYHGQEGQIKESIKCYELAVDIIKKLPKHNYFKQNILVYMSKLKSLYDEDNQYAKSTDIDIQMARVRRFSFLQIF